MAVTYSFCFRNYVAKTSQNFERASNFWEKGKIRERSTRVSLAVLAREGVNTLERTKTLKQVKTELMSCLASYRIVGAYDNIGSLVDYACQVELSLTVGEQVELDLYKAWAMLARGREDETEARVKGLLEVAKEQKLKDLRGKASKILSIISDLRTGSVVFGDRV